MAHRKHKRRDYGILLDDDSFPVNIVRLFLVGDPTAGKTTIKKSLTKDVKEIKSYTPTPGIDVATYDVTDVGKLSIWDAAGHVEYHVTHGMFLGGHNSTITVVYNLKQPQAIERLQYWLKFLKSGQHTTAMTKVKIVIIATHLDEFENKEEALRLAEKYFQSVRGEFGKVLDIMPNLLVVNARDGESSEMGCFKSALRDATKEIKGTRKIPKLCEAILEKKLSWVKPKKPVLTFQEYVERVKEVDALAKEKLAEISANYLEDMGEMFLVKNSPISIVVIDIQWLTRCIIGPILATTAAGVFIDQLKVLSPKAYYSKEELERFFKDIADITTVLALLQSLEMIVTFDGTKYIIPAVVPKERNSPSTFKIGRSIFCTDDTSMLSPSAFTKIQTRILKSFGSQGNQPIMSLGSMQFANETLGLVKQYDERDAINFAVEYKDGDAESCYNDLEKMTTIILSTLYEHSPGTSIATGYLSPQSIQDCPSLESVHHYTMEEIEAGERDISLENINSGEHGNGTVYHKSLKVREKTTDILVAGVDPHLLQEKGMECDYRWMLQKSRKELCTLLDSTFCLRKDYRSLAESLDVADADIKSIEKTCLETNESCTECVLAHWCATTGKRMSLRRLHALLKHPGLVGNAEAAKVIEDMMTAIGKRDMFEISVEDVSRSGMHDLILLWRAILRKSHKGLRERMSASGLSSTILTTEAMHEIAAIERSKGRKEAVDVLIDRLLELQTPKWIPEFQSFLKHHYPELLDDIVQVRDEFVAQTLFDSCRYMVSKVVNPKGDVFDLPDFGVCLEIPADALETEEMVSVSVIATRSREDLPPLDDRFIVAPIVKLEPDGIELRRPATLTVKHSGVELTQQNLQIWTKSRKYGHKEMWRIDFDGNINRSDPNTYQTNDSIKIRRTHFSHWCLLGRCSMKVQILPFIEKNLLVAKVIRLDVYAVKKEDSKIVKDNIKRSGRKIICCDESPKRYRTKKCLDLVMSTKDVIDRITDKSWKITPESVKISAANLQEGCDNACCNFTLRSTEPSRESIFGTLFVEQEDNDPLPVTLDYIMAETAAQQSASAHMKQDIQEGRQDKPGASNRSAETATTTDLLTGASQYGTESPDSHQVVTASGTTHCEAISKPGEGLMITAKQILDVEDEVGLADIKKLCQRLDLPCNVIQDAVFSVREEDIGSQKRALLNEWVRRLGNEATTGKLLRALLESGNKLAYDKLRNRWHV